MYLTFHSSSLDDLWIKNFPFQLESDIVNLERNHPLTYPQSVIFLLKKLSLEKHWFWDCSACPLNSLQIRHQHTRMYQKICFLEFRRQDSIATQKNPLSIVYGTFYSKKSASKIEFRLVINTLECTWKHLFWNFGGKIVLPDFSINKIGFLFIFKTFL